MRVWNTTRQAPTVGRFSFGEGFKCPYIVPDSSYYRVKGTDEVQKDSSFKTFKISS